MHAIEFETIPHQHAIQIPEGVRLVEGQTVRVLLFDDAAAEAYGAIRTDLERRGELIGAQRSCSRHLAAAA